MVFANKWIDLPKRWIFPLKKLTGWFEDIVQRIRSRFRNMRGNGYIPQVVHGFGSLPFALFCGVPLGTRGTVRVSGMLTGKISRSSHVIVVITGVGLGGSTASCTGRCKTRITVVRG